MAGSRRAGVRPDPADHRDSRDETSPYSALTAMALDPDLHLAAGARGLQALGGESALSRRGSRGARCRPARARVSSITRAAAQVAVAAPRVRALRRVTNGARQPRARALCRVRAGRGVVARRLRALSGAARAPCAPAMVGVAASRWRGASATRSRARAGARRRDRLPQVRAVGGRGAVGRARRASRAAARSSATCRS